MARSGATGRAAAFLIWARAEPLDRGCILGALGEVAESAEGSRLLSGYRGKTSVQGSNPCLSAISAQLAEVVELASFVHVAATENSYGERRRPCDDFPC